MLQLENTIYKIQLYFYILKMKILKIKIKIRISFITPFKNMNSLNKARTRLTHWYL